MEVEYLENGAKKIGREDELLDLLQNARRGDFGAFVLSHDVGGPSLSIFINKEVSYLHYLTSDEHHAGFQPTGMSPSRCEDYVDFLQTNGSEGDGYTMPRATLVPVANAYKAAVEFFHNPVLPAAISWLEL